MFKTIGFALIFCPICLLAAPPTVTEFIKIDQFGYRIQAKKVAVIADPQVGFNAPLSFSPGPTYKIRRWSDDVEVFSANITAWNSGATHDQSGDKVWWFDFSALTAPGSYYVFDPVNLVGSYQFVIGDNIYEEPLKKAMKMFFFQRCGVEKPVSHASGWADGVCHNHAGQDLASRLVTDQGNAATEKNLSGGWHDAGDYNKYVNFCHETLHDLLFAWQENPAAFGDDWAIPESGNGLPDILDEVKIELDWLLKMQLADGSCLMKLSVTDFSATSPASADLPARFYGPAQASATRVICSIFAHASIVYAAAGQTTFANTLLTKSELAWTWIVANPATSNYDNSGFQSANPEIPAWKQESVRTCAAAFLFAKTGTAAYRTWFDNNYAAVHAIAWTFWYEFEQTYQDALLFYTTISGGTAAVKTAIKNSAATSMNTNNPDYYTAWLNNTDAYRANMKFDNYVWGSNKPKCNVGSQFMNMIEYAVGPVANRPNYWKAAENYIHFLHGLNPISKIMMTKAESFGGDNDLNEMYHAHYGDGTPFDLDPPPGYIPGGFNRNYLPDGACGCTIAPPQNQPEQKSFLDWNTSWPENSWTITEPAIYTNAAYVRLISKFVASAALPVEWADFFGTAEKDGSVRLVWQTGSEINTDHFEMERENLASGDFEKIGSVRAAGLAVSEKSYQLFDREPFDGFNRYRLKSVDLDGKTSFFPNIVVVSRQATQKISLHPNPAERELTISFDGFSGLEPTRIRLFDLNGLLLFEQKTDEPGVEMTVKLAGFPRGFVVVEVLAGQKLIVEKLLLK